jgi:hypothetical protein
MIFVKFARFAMVENFQSLHIYGNNKNINGNCCQSLARVKISTAIVAKVWRE